MTYYTEAQVETYLRKRITELKGLCLKLPSTYVEGLPDRLILLPGGKALFVETKRPRGGQVAPLQYYWQDKLRKLGFISEIVKSYEDVDELVEAINEIFQLHGVTEKAKGKTGGDHSSKSKG